MSCFGNRVLPASVALLLILAVAAAAQVNQRVSLDKSGAQANDTSIFPAISGDGRYVAFMSWATNLVAGDTNGVSDIFVRDRLLGTTERVSVSSTGEQANAFSQEVSISADGRFVAFQSLATNLVSQTSSGAGDVYVRDLVNHTTELVSVGLGNVPANSGSAGGSISGDGRFVAFPSDASNLVPGDSFGNPTDFFVRDRLNGTTECVSNLVGGGHYNDKWFVEVKISADGRFVAFSSYATNLVPGITDAQPHVYVRDRLTHFIDCASIGLDGQPGLSPDWAPAISGDGRFVVFMNSDSGDFGGSPRIYVRDHLQGTTERICVSSRGEFADRGGRLPAISSDGRYVVFESDSTNLVAGDTNVSADVFLRDRVAETTERVNLGPNGEQAGYGGGGFYPSISSDGRFVAFSNFARDLVPGDTNQQTDVYVRDRAHPSFARLCEPNSPGVTACPCGNPPQGRERGCDNSSRTGGAILDVSGGEYLSSDSLFFTTTGEPPSSLTFVLQASSLHAGGAVYGHGVNCLTSPLLRLYAKTSTGDGITAPDFRAFEAPVHERAASLGDAIPFGSTRWYVAAYRDPLGFRGCPSAPALNTTPAREVVWLP